MNASQVEMFSRVVSQAAGFEIKFEIEMTGGNCRALVARDDAYVIVITDGMGGLAFSEDGDALACGIYTVEGWVEGDDALVYEEAPVGALLGQFVAECINKVEEV